MMRRYAVAALALVSATHQVGAQPNYGKDKLLLRIPISAGEPDVLNGTPFLRMTLSFRNDSLLVNGRDDWETSGEVPAVEYRVQDFKKEVKLGYNRVFITGKGPGIQLRLPLNDSLALTLFSRATASTMQRVQVSQDHASAVSVLAFDAALREHVPAKQRDDLIREAQTAEENTRFRIREVQGKHYVEHHLGASKNVYNDARMNAGQRAAKFANEVLLSRLKRLGELLQASAADGVEITVSVAHRNFVTAVNAYEPTTFDNWEVRATFSSIEKFRNAEITGQQLLDESIVLINGNRTKIVLSDG